MATTTALDADVFALARSDDEACVQVFFVRGTVVADTDSFMLDGASETPDASDAEILGAFLAQFFESATYVPRSVLLSQAPADREQLREALRSKRGGAVEIAVPERGELRALVATAEENAREALAMHRVRWLADRDKTESALLHAAGRARSAGAPAPHRSATTSPRSRAATRWPRWWCSRTAARAAISTAASASAPSRARTTSPRCARC